MDGLVLVLDWMLSGTSVLTIDANDGWCGPKIVERLEVAVRTKDRRRRTGGGCGGCPRSGSLEKLTRAGRWKCRDVEEKIM